MWQCASVNCESKYYLGPLQKTADYIYYQGIHIMDTTTDWCNNLATILHTDHTWSEDILGFDVVLFSQGWHRVGSYVEQRERKCKYSCQWLYSTSGGSGVVWRWEWVRSNYSSLTQHSQEEQQEKRQKRRRAKKQDTNRDRSQIKKRWIAKAWESDRSCASAKRRQRTTLKNHPSCDQLRQKLLWGKLYKMRASFLRTPKLAVFYSVQYTVLHLWRLVNVFFWYHINPLKAKYVTSFSYCFHKMQHLTSCATKKLFLPSLFIEERMQKLLEEFISCT